MVQGCYGRPAGGYVAASGVGSGSHYSCGLFGCVFSLALPSGILDVLGVVEVGVTFRCVRAWVFDSCGARSLVGFHVVAVM